MVENSKEINEKIEQVIRQQKIDGFSVESFRGLGQLRRAFEYSINEIDQILSNDDVKSALGDIVRDWNIDQYNRNEVIVNIMKLLAVDLKEMKKNEDES